MKVRLAATCAAVVLLAGCGSQSTPAAAPVPTYTMPTLPSFTMPSFTMPSMPTLTPMSMPSVAAPLPVTTSELPATSTASKPAAPVAPAKTPAMPNVVCMNLQDAQDKIQKVGVFYSKSVDATGKGRHQMLDRDWIVVSQVPAPGAGFGEGDATLSVVKTSEDSRC